MSTAVVVTALFVPRPGNYHELHDALLESIPDVHAEPGCELYAIHAAPDDVIFMIEKWTSHELLDLHANGPAVKALNARIEGLIAKPVTVTLMTPLPSGTPEQGLL
jgi:quinol monooxygenase YgiN